MRGKNVIEVQKLYAGDIEQLASLPAQEQEIPYQLRNGL